MSKYVFTYHDGGEMPDTEEGMKEVMDAWSAWFGSLGDAVVDGGNPFGAGKIVTSASVTDGTKAGGYSVISAADLGDAVAKAQGCPVLAGGGTVAVHEALDM